MTSIAPELEGKRLALLREVIPELSYIAVFWNPLNAFHINAEKEVQAAARALRMKVQSLAVRTSDELDGAFAAIMEQRPGALVVLADRVFLHGRDRIMTFASQQHLPGVYAYRELVDAGGSCRSATADAHGSQAHVEPDITMETVFVDRPLDGFGAVEVTGPE